jgi:VanZ family protein
MKQNNKKKISYLAVFIWMGAIFYLSHQSGDSSGGLSSGITEMVLNMINTIFPSLKVDMDLFHHIIRKLAHFTAYFILAILVINALRISNVSGFKSIIITLLISIIYAATDEFHQSFIPGRGPSIKDVFIDSFGASFGLAIYSAFSKLKKRRVS